MENLNTYPHKTGETVVYRKQGIYEITSVKEQIIGDIKKDSYVFSSVYDKNATIYVPVDNENLTSQIESVLSTDEINLIIDQSETTGITWIENNTQRAICYDEIIKSNDLSRILAVLRLYMLQKEGENKKSFRAFAKDERIFSAAMKNITEAFAYPLGIAKPEVVSYITDRLKNK